MTGFDFKFCPNCGSKKLKLSFPIDIRGQSTSKECQDCFVICTVSAQQSTPPIEAPDDTTGAFDDSIIGSY